MTGDYRNFKQATVCSVAFLGIYIAVYSAQNLQSAIYEADGYGSLGFLSNSIAYVGQGIGSVFCQYFMQRIGDIKSMAYSSLLSLPFIICLVVPSISYYYPNSTNFFFSYGFVFILTVFTSFFNGFGEGIAQPASGKFISDCATEKTKGFFFAYFWAFYMGSQVFGNLIASLALGHLAQYYFVIIVTVICASGVTLLFFLRSPFVNHNNFIQRLDEFQASRNQINEGLDDSLLLENVSGVTGRMNLKEVAISMWQLASSKRFLYFIPQLFWTGVSIAFFSGNLVTLMYQTIDGDDQEKFKLSTYAMILFGMGEILGCFFIGFIVDRFGSKVAGAVNITIMSIMTIITLVYCINWNFNFLAFVMCFLWGFQDSAINTHSQEILGFEFDNNSEPFSVYNILQCLACSIFSLIEIAVDSRTDFIIFTIFIGIFGCLCCTATMFFDFRETKSHHGVLEQLVSPIDDDQDEDQDIIEVDAINDQKNKSNNNNQKYYEQ